MKSFCSVLECNEVFLCSPQWENRIVDGEWYVVSQPLEDIFFFLHHFLIIFHLHAVCDYLTLRLNLSYSKQKCFQHLKTYVNITLCTQPKSPRRFHLCITLWAYISRAKYLVFIQTWQKLNLVPHSVLQLENIVSSKMVSMSSPETIMLKYQFL